MLWGDVCWVDFCLLRFLCFNPQESTPGGVVGDGCWDVCWVDFCVILVPFFHKVGPQTPVISVGGAHNSRFGNVLFSFFFPSFEAGEGTFSV